MNQIEQCNYCNNLDRDILRYCKLEKETAYGSENCVETHLGETWYCTRLEYLREMNTAVSEEKKQ